MSYTRLICGFSFILLGGCAANSSPMRAGLVPSDPSIPDVHTKINTAFDGNDWKNPGFVALSGGRVGASVGAYMDRQQQEMEQAMAGTGVEVARTSENTLHLNLPSGILFAFDTRTLTSTARVATRNLARLLRLYPDTTVTITAHTDNLGPSRANQALSEQRAASVAHSLLRNGVEPGRLRKLGMGERMPKYPNDTEQNRTQNHRVEIIIIANDDGGAHQGYSRR